MEQSFDACWMPITVRPDSVMVRGDGSYLWDDRGRRYLDFVQGWAVNALGHAAPEIRRALTEQAARLITASPGLHNENELELGRRLVALSGLYQAHFTSSGAEANEAAVKLARKWGRTLKAGAFEVITTHGAFHGRTLAMMAASGKPGWDELFPPNMPGFRKVAFGDAGAVADAIGDQTVAVMVEPIQGEAGVVVPPRGYLRSLRELCDQHDLLLVLDEIQTGMGRTGKLFAHQHEHVVPDILTLGKGLGGGVPIAAVIANQRASCFQPGDQGGTYNGNALMTAVALAVLDVVSDPVFLGGVTERGEYLAKALGQLGAGSSAARGAGLLRAVTLASESSQRIRDVCFARGLLINAPRPSSIRLMPSLRVSEAEIDEMASVLGIALRASA
jgi:acetylornithine/N-succinyldiaminopimelate aminotransferase